MRQQFQTLSNLVGYTIVAVGLILAAHAIMWTINWAETVMVTTG